MSRFRYASGAAAVSIMMIAGAIAEQSNERPTFLPNGVVRVPAFELPPSDYISPEARQALQARAKVRMELSDAGLTIEQARANIERYVAPDLADVQQRYAVDITPREIAGVRTRVIVPKSGEADPRRVLINLHGGAFNRCADGCALIESIPVAAVGRFKVITVNYREAPEYTFPAASEDVTAVYQELLKTYKPENIGVYGCSAGSALTAQAGAWIITNGLPVPGAFGMISAGAVRRGAGDSATIAAFIDGSMPAPGAAAAPAAGQLRSYFAGADPRSPLISPADHLDLIARFPPTLLITGTRAFEMSSVIYTHSQLLKAGVASHLLVGEGMEHCYIYHTNMPEARDAINVLVRFFDQNLGHKAGRKPDVVQ